jgi:hypothetical protein
MRYSDLPPVDNFEAKLELTLIDEFLRARGHSLVTVATLPEAEREPLMRDAAIYAAGKLAEIEARAHYVQDLHRHE